MGQSLIYITAGTRDEAVTIGRTLVESRLAACANVLGGISSIYWWEGALTEDDEVSLLVKTREELVDKVVAKVKEIHSYDCPCVVSIPISGGNPAFLEWIDAETADSKKG